MSTIRTAFDVAIQREARYRDQNGLPFLSERDIESYRRVFVAGIMASLRASQPFPIGNIPPV